MNVKDRFHQAHPQAFFLEKDLPKVEQYLQTQGWLADKEEITNLEKPGEGNMNFVLRVQTTTRSFILKQARPWVEKFPTIDAPVERVAVEAQFFTTLQSHTAIKDFIPAIIGFDQASFILVTEDLGVGADYSFLYQDGNILKEEESKRIVQFLNQLHAIPVSGDFPSNQAMRVLNHEHIFNFPFAEDNGFDLDEIEPGLQRASMLYKKDVFLKEKIKKCGEVYLSKGNHLLHGDFYPGSWLKVEDGLKVIDPEFGFVGPAEFDLGVLIAHLMMANQPAASIQNILDNYQSPPNFSESLLAQFAGIEIMRRIIGIAQLPLSLDLNQKKRLLLKAAYWIQNEVVNLG